MRPLKHELRTRYKVRELALFGSFVRAEQNETSDVDVLVDFVEGATLFDLVGLALFLEETLKRKVDVVPRESLRREFRETVLRQMVPV